MYEPDFYWSFNCSPGPDDYDYKAYWGEITIQRNNLQYNKVTLYHWNEINSWKMHSQIYTPLNAPTSEPFSFTPQILNGFCKQNCDHEVYFNKKYKFSTSFEVVYGGNGQQLTIDEYFFDSDSISTNLKYCRSDIFYNDLHNCSGSLPLCEET